MSELPEVECLDKNMVKKIVLEHVSGLANGQVEVNVVDDGDSKLVGVLGKALGLAKEMVVLLEMTLELSRPHRRLTEVDFRDELVKRLRPKYGDVAESIEVAVHRKVEKLELPEDDDGRVFAQHVSVKGRNPEGKEGSPFDDEVLVPLIMEILKERGVDLTGLPNLVDGLMDDAFKSRVERVEARTDAEVARFREEIDSLFPDPPKGGSK